jgi:hypothetical protein
MKLIYINKVGKDWDGKLIYEFIFSKTTEGVDGEAWDTYPASGQPEPPDKQFIDAVGRIETDEFSLICIQDSDTFSVWDAVDGVVALCWEDITEYEEYPQNRLKFFFGDDMSIIKDSLYAKDITIEWKYSKNELQKGHYQ